jgi:hypothetical protein
VSSFGFDKLLQTATAELQGDHTTALMQTFQAPAIKRTIWMQGFVPPEVDYADLFGDDPEQEWRRLEVTPLQHPCNALVTSL